METSPLSTLSDSAVATTVYSKVGRKPYLEVVPTDDGRVLVRPTALGAQRLPTFWTAWLYTLVKSSRGIAVMSAEMLDGNVVVSWSKSEGLVQCTQSLASEIGRIRTPLRRVGSVTPNSVRWRVAHTHKLPYGRQSAIVSTIKLPTGGKVQLRHGESYADLPGLYVELVRSHDCIMSADDLALIIEYHFAIACV